MILYWKANDFCGLILVMWLLVASNMDGLAHYYSILCFPFPLLPFSFSSLLPSSLPLSSYFSFSLLHSTLHLLFLF